MASKNSNNISDSTRGASRPNLISPSNKLLSSIISLPANSAIVYATYALTPSLECSPEDIIELARRQLVVQNKSDQLSILDSLLPAPRLHKEDKCLLVFSITSHDHLETARERINALQFDKLSSAETFIFTPEELYPCSSACASEREPCPTCLSQDREPNTPSSSTHLPRIPLRNIYAAFLDAVRDRLIDDIAEASLITPSENANGRHVKKFKNGFLLGPVNDFTSSEWGASWEHHVKNRPLIHCHLFIHMSRSRLVIHPILHPTPYLPLLLSSPLPSGTPINLLPYAVPAYYLTTYAGPTSTLTAQFEASLCGLGVGPWKASSQTYIIAWISIQNKQGEEKGKNIIWPLSLCLAYHPASSHLRKPLAYVPPIPAQLQPSPPPPLPPAITFASSNGQQSLSSSRPRLARRACTSLSIDSFRSLNLGLTKDMDSVAMEIGGYVDAVAKDRERERERIRREREAGSSPKLPTASAGPSRTTSPMKPPATATELTSSMTTPSLALRDAISLDSDIIMEQSYPSPAQTIPSSNAPVDTKMDHGSPGPSSSLQPELDPHPPPTPPPSDLTDTQAYDPFGHPDSTWAQPPRDFMDIDYDMGFGMSIDPSGSGGGAADRMTMDDFEDGLTFTDDDFSFFDKPSVSTPRVASGTAAAPVSALSHSGVESGLTPAAGPAPFGLSPPFYGDIGSGAGHSSGTPGHPGSSPWVSSVLAEAFSPRFDGPLSDLIAHSPDKTISSHSAPATPTVQLSPNSDHSGRLARAHHRPSIFDPIPFAVSHRISDGKYVSGKFSLPSPPDEERGWKVKYGAATDPRIGVVRKLMDVKRKSSDQGSRDSRMPPSWIREHDDWENSPPDETNGGKSEDSEDDDIELDDSPVVSRPSTPLPAYLPPGPTLLHAQFRHSELLPTSTPLRPPGVAVAHTPIASAIAAASIPTPASPAAGKNSKSLEAAAYTLAKEAVENSVWAKAWYLPHSAKHTMEVWQADVKTIVQLLESVRLLQGPLDIKSLFDLEPDSPQASLELLVPPMLTVGKSDAIIQVLPSALRFWEKLGLGPRGGKKNVTAFVLFEDDGEEKQLQVERWLGSMSATYAAQNLGAHTPGRYDSSLKDGLVPMKFDSFSKSLSLFIASLSTPESDLVFYLIPPSSLMTVASPALRQLYAAVRRATISYSETQIIFQFVPEQLIVDSLENSASRDQDLEILSHSLYERILRPVDRYMSRRFFEHGERIRGYFQEPAFTLARPVLSKVKFLRQTSFQSLDVVDRYTLLHVGYLVSPCGKWILAACVDQRAEAHDFGVWPTQTEAFETYIVTQVWSFALQFARKANVEWRIVFAKLGSMGENELHAWVAHLTSAVPACRELPMLHVSVLSVERNHPWTFITPPNNNTKPSPISKCHSSKEMSGAMFVDAFSTYALFPTHPMPIFSDNQYPHACRSEPSFISDEDDLPLSDTLPVHPLSTTTLIHSPADTGYTSISMLHIHFLHVTKSPSSSLTIPDTETRKEITRNYYELAILGAARWRLHASAILPIHLGALEIMCSALMKGDLD